jgi:hypothetical protein
MVMSPTRLDDTLARLAAVDWVGDWKHTHSRIRLMHEYLRCAAIWATHLDCRDRWPFFDIAANIDPTVRVEADVVEQATAHLSFYPKRSCAAALEFAHLLDAASDRVPALPHPFEPLLRMFERGGGGFDRHHGDIVVDTGSIIAPAIDHFERAQPFTTMDPDELDALDRQ